MKETAARVPWLGRASTFALTVSFLLCGCTDGQWRAGEWRDMENMCRNSALCSAPCRGGESSAQDGCIEAE
jgi:hypothetical protein